MHRIWPVAAASLAIGTIGAAASEPPNDRLRERIPVQTRERAAPAVPAPGDPDDLSSEQSAILAAPQRIQLDGAIALSHDAFENIFLRYTGRGLTRADLAKLAREVTDVYRAEGYFLSRATIPPQTVKDGVLKLSIEEGRFQEVEFEGGNGSAFRDYFNALLAEVPARRSTLERALLILGGLGGVSVDSSRTAPIPNVRGAYKLILKVNTDLADGQIYLDNRGEGGGGALQVSTQAGFNGIGDPGARLDVSIFTDGRDPAKRQFVEANYSAPLGLRGTIVSVSASASNSVDGAFGEGRYQSRGTDVTLSVRHPVVLSRAHSMWVNAELTQSNSDANLEGFGLRRDELSLIRAGASWDIRDDWGGRNRLNLTATFGRDAFKTPSPAHPMAQIDDGASFTKFTLLASRTQKLFGSWSVFASVRGQFSSDNLPDDEEISFGGARWGRAYDYGEIDGDSGAAGQLELRFTREKLDLADSLQAYAFSDYATTWIRDGEGEADTLSSAGLGLRAAFGGGYRAGVEAAVPLNRTPSGHENRHPRVFATFSKEF